MSLIEGGGNCTATVKLHLIAVKVLISILKPQNGLTYLVVMILAILSLASAYDSSLNGAYTLKYNVEAFLAVFFNFTRNVMFSCCSDTSSSTIALR